MCVCVLDFTKENIFMTLVKDGKEDFLQGGLLQWGFCSERRGSTPSTTTSGDG